MKVRSIVAAIALVAMTGLSACTGFQTSSEVSVGLKIDDISPVDFSWVPNGPQIGAQPRDIVQGFLDAAIAPEEGWRTAKQFLSEEFAMQWNPAAGAVVDVVSKRSPVERPVDASPTPSAVPEVVTTTVISMTVSAIATVDASGVYRVSDTGTMQWDFELETQGDDQWRITKAPDGLLIDRFAFDNVYDDYDLAFFDPTWSFLVPDRRWYPTVTAVRDIVNGVLDGASPWTVGAVSTAIPEGTRALASIPVDANGSAHITLSGLDAVDAATVGRIKLQLLESLSHTSVRSVVVSSDTRELAAPIASVYPTVVNARALIGTENGFGYFTTEGLDNVDNFDDGALDFPVASWEMSEAAGRGVALSNSGEVVRLDANSSTHATVDVRQGLIAPTIGPFGDIWTVQATSPNGLLITMPGGAAMEIPTAFAELTSIAEMQISRDGTRLAVIGSIGSQTQLYVYGIVRNAQDGVPQSLGHAETIREIRGTVPNGLSWLDNSTVGYIVANETDTTVVVQPLSGPSSTSRAVADVVQIAGSNDRSSIWIRTKDGVLYTSRGTGWTVIATDVTLLARQQGASVGT